MEWDWIIVDSCSILFKLYYGCLKSYSPNSPEIHNTIRKFFFGGIIKHIRQFKGYPLFCFDGAVNNFRKEKLPTYKSNRLTPSPDIIKSIIDTEIHCKNYGLYAIKHHKYESDDLIASLCKQLHGNKLIIGVDKDLLQLINTQCKIFNHKSNILFNEDEVFKKYSVYPHQIVDYLSMVGDNSDSIPGVPRYGHKTSAKLLMEYDNCDNIPNFPYQDIIKRNREIITLVNDISMDTPIPLSIEETIRICKSIQLHKDI